MRRVVSTLFVLFLVTSAFAQNDTTINRTFIPKPTAERASDHFLLQLGYTTWIGKPDSIHTGGLPRTFNMYLMLDFGFKTNPHWSAALGPGIASDNMYFDKMYVGIKDLTSTLRFDDLSDTVHFKKYKLATTYLELPVELRYRFNPNNDAGSVKIAIGAKVGTLLNAHVKGVDLQDKNGNDVLPYTQKESSKRFLNKTRLSVMGRFGIGHYSLFASYAITPIFKEGFAPTVRPLTIGLTLSGL